MCNVGEGGRLTTRPSYSDSTTPQVRPRVEAAAEGKYLAPERQLPHLYAKSRETRDAKYIRSTERQWPINLLGKEKEAATLARDMKP